MLIIIFLSTNAYYFEKEKINVIRKINVMRIIIKKIYKNNDTRQKTKQSQQSHLLCIGPNQHECAQLTAVIASSAIRLKTKRRQVEWD